MKRKSFDDIIKSKLEQFRIEADAEAWELYQTSLSNHEFDKQISDKVETHQLEVFPKDWDTLLDKIEKEEVPNDFDAMVGAKLSGISIDIPPDWDEFEQILDRDEQFDAEVSSKVKHHTVASSDNQWPKLSAHLEEIEKRRNRIVITKFVEAAIFILFVLTIMQLFPINNINKSQPYRTFAVIQNIENNNANIGQEKIEMKEATKNLVTSSSDAIASEEITLTAENELDVVNTNLLLSNNTVSINANEEVNSSATVRNLDAVDPIENIEITMLAANITDNTASIGNKFYNELASIENNAEDDQMMALDKHENLPHNSLLASLDLKEIDYSRAQFFIDPLNALSNVKRGQYWINTYGATDINFISTPYDIHLETDAYQNGAYGFSVGTTVSYETNNWELESGVAYTSLNYFPKQYTEKTGSAFGGVTETTLKEIIFNIVEVPLNFKYKIFRKKGWAVYANSGLSIGALASATYDIDRETYPVFASAAPRASEASGEFRKKTFDPGLMNGGELNNNFFATLNTGMGVSKKLSEGISFYVQPTYHHNLSVKGLGPNNDVHNRLSMQIGTKVRL